jgi:hypothetical protein
MQSDPGLALGDSGGRALPPTDEAVEDGFRIGGFLPDDRTLIAQIDEVLQYLATVLAEAGWRNGRALRRTRRKLKWLRLKIRVGLVVRRLST